MPRSAAGTTACLLFFTGFFFTGAASADDWTTAGNDAQRSGWVRADTKISTASVRSPEFRLLWKMEFDNEARRGSALTAPVLLDFLISHRGFRSLAFVAGSAGSVFTVDTDLARPEWRRPLGAAPGGGSARCPGGMTANLSRPTAAAMPSLLGFAARGRRTPGKSGAGKPKEGAVTLAAAAARAPSRPAAPQQRNARTRPPAGRSLRGLSLVYALAADGMLHSLYTSNGRNRGAPAAFLPPNADAKGLIVVDNTAYVATANGCGGAPNGVWALDLETKKVSHWKSTGGSIAGLLGPAIGADGVVYAATVQGGIAALEAKTLALRALSPGGGFHSSPVIVDYKGEDYLAAAAADGSLRLYAAADLGAPAAQTEPFLARWFSSGALAAWRGADGVTRLLAAGVAADQGILVSWKIAERGGKPVLERDWEFSLDSSPLPPIVVNGVVFAVASGGGTMMPGTPPSPGPIPPPAAGGVRGSAHARLYALDGVTGEALWDSGAGIEAAASGYALSAGPAHVYLTTSDSALYAFGIPIEH